MTEIRNSQAPNAPQNSPIGDSIMRIFRGRLGALATVMALGVPSAGCTVNMQYHANNPSANPSVKREMATQDPDTSIETKASDQPASPPKPDAPKPVKPKPAETPPPEVDPPTSDDKDNRSMWEKIKDRIKAEAFKKGVGIKCGEKAEELAELCLNTATAAIDKMREKCEGETGILAKTCSKTITIATDQAQKQCGEKGKALADVCTETAMFAADQACAQIDNHRLKPTIESVCGNDTIKKFCTGKSEQALDAFIAYCAEKKD